MQAMARVQICLVHRCGVRIYQFAVTATNRTLMPLTDHVVEAYYSRSSICLMKVGVPTAGT